MNSCERNTEKYKKLIRLLNNYGEIRSVERDSDSFHISDLYLNGDGELRLDYTARIMLSELTEEAESSENKADALREIESCVKLWICEEDDPCFIEYADFVLDNIDFSKLSVKDHYEGVIEFLESDMYKEETSIYFIGR